MSKNKKKRKQPSHQESTIKQTEEKLQETQEKLYQEALERLKKAEEGEEVEKLLKNEAYAFLLAEGLMDKFLDFREYFQRTKAQNALYNLVAEASLGGLWVDV
jgi:predicted PP-loop superfamily ATPase